MEYTVNGLLGKDDPETQIHVPCLVIGTFMTIYDVHINRMPTSGFLSYTNIDPMEPNNLSMSPIEKELLNDLELQPDQLKYNRLNERRLCTVYCPDLKQPYYMIQVADFEIDVIAEFYKSGKFVPQGHRFAVIKFGSQVDVIIPFINEDVEYESLVNGMERMHVKAGLDKLVRVIRG